jgi:hypothetical protein
MWTPPLNVFYAPQIRAIDAYAQMVCGGGGWTTGTSVLSVYNSSIFIPVDTARLESEVDDIFFADDSLGADGELAGVRTRGQCQTAVLGPVDYDTFAHQMCPQLLGALSPWRIANVSSWDAKIFLAWCSTKEGFTDMMDTPSSFASALIWLNTSSRSEVVQGVVMCNVPFSTGSAKLDGNDRTSAEFKEVAMYNGDGAGV